MREGVGTGGSGALVSEDSDEGTADGADVALGVVLGLDLQAAKPQRISTAINAKTRPCLKNRFGGEKVELWVNFSDATGRNMPIFRLARRENTPKDALFSPQMDFLDRP